MRFANRSRALALWFVLVPLSCCQDLPREQCPSNLQDTPPMPDAPTVALCGPDASYWVGVDPLSVLYPQVDAALAVRCGEDAGSSAYLDAGPNPEQSPYFCAVFDGGV